MRKIDRVLKGSTKAGQDIIARAMNDIGYDLQDVYSSFSRDKYNHWADCVALKNSLCGSNFSICSKNTYGFTCSFEAWENGIEHYLVFCTKDHTYKVYTER